jgi:hypothetical protein
VVIDKFERHLVVSLTMIMGSVLSLNFDPLPDCEVTRNVDPRTLWIFPDHWIYVMVSLTLTTMGEKEC